MKRKRILRTILLVLGLFILALGVVYHLPEKKKQYSSPHFAFKYSEDIDPNKIKALADALEESYPMVSRNLNASPASNIETNVYSARWRYGKATGFWFASGSIEGPAKLHFLEHAWGEDDNKKIAIHEFVHAVVVKKLIDLEPQPFDSAAFEKKFATFPVWLWEAISCYEAVQNHPLKDKPYLANGAYPSLAELNSRKGAKIYAVGYSMIEFILQNFGRDKLNDLITNYGNLPKTLNLSEEEFTRQWYAFVQEKYFKL